MKVNIKSCIGAVVLFVTISSCNKYEEGPAFSFRRLVQRISNTWKFDSYLINGIEKKGESLYSSQKQFWFASGQLEITYINPSDNASVKVDGKWFLFDDNKKINVVKFSNNSTVTDTTTFNIIKAKENALWLRTADASEEIHFIPLN